MIYYIICFNSSLFLFWFGQKIRHGQCEPFRWLVYGIALLLPAVLAGVRDWSIGTDVLGYVYPIFKEACVVPYIEGFSPEYNNWIGVGYLWLNIAISQISHNLNVALFFIMLIEMIFVFLVIYQWSDKFPIWLGMLVFYTFFFNFSLNATRQCLALSIAFFGIKYIFKKKFLFFAFWVGLGYLFHASALLILVYYPLFWYANKFTSAKAILLFSVTFLLLIVFSNQILIPFLYSISDIFPFAKSATYYLTFVEKDGSGYKNFIYFGFLVLLFLYKRKVILAQFPDIGNFLMILTISVSIAQLLTFVGGGFVTRFIVISNWWLCFLIPAIFYSYNKIFPKVIVNVMIMFYSFFYWYYIFIYLEFNETTNYSSAILSSIF